MQVPHSGLLGTYLSRLRRSHKYPQSLVANYIGVSRQCVGHYEKGIRTPGLGTLKKLAYLYEVPYENMLKLMEENEDVHLPSPVLEGMTAPEKTTDSAPDPQEEQLIRIFRVLPEKEREQVLRYIQTLDLQD